MNKMCKEDCDGHSDKMMPENPFGSDEFFETVSFMTCLGMYLRGEEGNSGTILSEFLKPIIGNRKGDAEFTEDMAVELMAKVMDYCRDSLDIYQQTKEK